MTSVPPNMPIPVYPPFLEPVGVPSGPKPVSGFGVLRVGHDVGRIIGGRVPVETLGLGGEPTAGNAGDRNAGRVFNNDLQNIGGMIHDSE